MKKIIYLIIILILVGVGFYLWKNKDKYFFQGEVPYEISNDEDDNEGRRGNDLMEGGDEEGQQKDEESVEGEASGDVITGENQELSDILQNHCNNNCEDKKNTSDYKYCLEICGINDDPKQSSDCDGLTENFEKNVCYKNQAIKEKNSGICNSITDVRLKENCKDRVIEELFE